MDDKYPYLDEWKIDAVAFEKLEQYIDSNGGTKLPEIPAEWVPDGEEVICSHLIDDIIYAPEEFLEVYLPDDRLVSLYDGDTIKEKDISIIIDSVENKSEQEELGECVWYQILHCESKCIMATIDSNLIADEGNFYRYNPDEGVNTSSPREDAVEALSKALLNKKISFL